MPGVFAFPFVQRPVGRESRPRVRAFGPIVAPAAIRVPDPRQFQIDVPFPAGTPQLFVHEGARQLLERRLSQSAGQPTILSITDNRRSVLAFSKEDGVLRVRMHHMFLDAPAPLLSALVRFIAKGDREASNKVGQYIEQNGHRIKATEPFLQPLTTRGTHHDLLAIFTALNHQYFGGTLDALVTWGRMGRRAGPESPRKSVKLGSYSTRERLIRIHPLLDRAWVPRYFVAYVVYHEMLHHVIAPLRVGKRRILHSPEFFERETMFRDHARALAWERAHIFRLLRARAQTP